MKKTKNIGNSKMLQRDRQTDRQTDGWTAGRLGNWTDRLPGGRKNEQT